MLVIRRRPDESILIDDRIELRLRDTLAGGCLVEIDGPGDVRLEWIDSHPGTRRRCPTSRGRLSAMMVLDARGTLFFDRRVEVTLVEIRPFKAHFGVIAPKSVAVNRAELVRDATPPSVRRRR